MVVDQVFREFDRKGRRSMGKNDFLSALLRLGLVLTHGQRTVLCSMYRGDYTAFLELANRRAGLQVRDRGMMQPLPFTLRDMDNHVQTSRAA